MLIGRKREKEKIERCLEDGRGFILLGSRGIGKTALLRWAYLRAKGKRAFISARTSRGAFMLELCRQFEGEREIEAEWEVKQDGISTYLHRVGKIEEYPVFDKMAKAELWDYILENLDGGFLFVDDLEKAGFEISQMLYELSTRFVICLAGNGPFRDDQKKVIWGCEEIELAPLKSEEAICLAKRLGRGIDIARCGIPGRIIKGEGLKEGRYVEGEEVNIAPVFLIILALMIAIRFIGLGTGERELYLLGGIGTALAVVLRFFIYRGMRS